MVLTVDEDSATNLLSPNVVAHEREVRGARPEKKSGGNPVHKPEREARILTLTSSRGRCPRNLETHVQKTKRRSAKKKNREGPAHQPRNSKSGNGEPTSGLPEKSRTARSTNGGGK